MFFRKKVITDVSYFDWISRLASDLEEATSIVKLSRREDSFENIVKVFKSKAKDTLKIITSAVVSVDIYGVYILNPVSEEKVYLITFRDKKIAEIPLDRSFKDVGCNGYIDTLLLKEYKRTHAKLKDQGSRLSKEERVVLRKQDKITRMINDLVGPAKAYGVNNSPEEEYDEDEDFETLGDLFNDFFGDPIYPYPLEEYEETKASTDTTNIRSGSISNDISISTSSGPISDCIAPIIDSGPALNSFANKLTSNDLKKKAIEKFIKDSDLKKLDDVEDESLVHEDENVLGEVVKKVNKQKTQAPKAVVKDLEEVIEDLKDDKK